MSLQVPPKPLSRSENTSTDQAAIFHKQPLRLTNMPRIEFMAEFMAEFIVKFTALNFHKSCPPRIMDILL
jgi:hypothetical protein